MEEALSRLGHAGLRCPALLFLRSPSSKASTAFRLNNLSSSTVICCSSKWADRLISDFHSSATTTVESSSPFSPDPPLISLHPSALLPSADRSLPLPIDFYEVLGAETHLWGDGIRRAYEARGSRPPQYGYSQDALMARRQIIQAAYETLFDPGSRRDYDRALLEEPDSTVTTYVPWDKVPGALCVLQETGQAELVLRIGKALLLERLPKTFKQDVVLSVVLAYVDLSRQAMALHPPDFVSCCEVLEMALKLLQEEGASNLAPDLLAQIDETLEEIMPQCILDLLALPLDSEHQIKREEGLVGVRNILWTVGRGGASAIGGFTWKAYMNETFIRMTAAEQVDLFAARPSNLPAEDFEVYGFALALVAQAFVKKKPHLIKTADNLFQQLQQTTLAPLGTLSKYAAKADSEIPLALERALCSLLLGEVDDCRMWLGVESGSSLNQDPAIVEFIMDNSGMNEDGDILPGLCKLLETWLKDVVFSRFRDTQDINFKLGDYYDDSMVLRYLEQIEGGKGSPLAAAAGIVKIGAEATAAFVSVKSSVLQAFHKVFPLSNKEERLTSAIVKIGAEEATAPFGSVKLSVLQAFHKVFPLTNKEERLRSEECSIRNDFIIESQTAEAVLIDDQDKLSFQQEIFCNSVPQDSNVQGLINEINNPVVKIMSAGIVVGLLTVIGIKCLPRSSFPATRKGTGSAVAANFINIDENLVEEAPKMDAKLAETMVRRWQNVKSRALGPNHSLEELSEILEGTMLKMWTDRAVEIAKHGWFWEYSLLGVTIDNVTVASDVHRAVVEATIEETAHLIDDAHLEHNDSCTNTYTTRYETVYSTSDWKIAGGAVLRSERIWCSC